MSMNRLHYYKAVFMKATYPEYAVRDWSNGVTGYKVKLDEGLCKELNFSYMGYMSEEELDEKISAKSYGKALSKLRA